MKNQPIHPNLSLLFALFIFLLPSTLYAAPPALPATFWGRVSAGGNNVAIGTTVAVWSNDTLLKEATVQPYEGNTVYAVTVAQDDPATQQVEGATEGATLTFKVNGQPTQQSGVWQSGTSSELNLTIEQAHPALLSLTPNFGDVGNSAEVMLVGDNTHFVNGTTTANFGAGITVNQLIITSATAATAQLTLASNAAPGFRTITLTTGDESVSLENGFTVRGPGLDISLSSATIVAGLPVVVTVVADDDLTNLSVLAVHGGITYDTDVLELVEVSQAGTLLDGWAMQKNLDSAGHILFAAYNANPLTGSGILLNLHFNVIGAPGSSSPLTLSELTLNEGTPGATPHNGEITVAGLSLGGRVSYRGPGSPVLGAGLSYQGPTALETTTNAVGDYTFGSLRVAGGILTPAKIGDNELAVSALDAARIAQCDVGKRPASDCPRDVADTSGDGTVGVYDAALIARYLVGIEEENTIGDWCFLPPFRTYQPLDANKNAEHFEAWIVGDVTYNYNVEESLAASAVSSAATLLLASAQPESDTAFILPLALRQSGSSPLYAFELTLHYDAEVVRLEEVTGGESLGPDWEVVHNITKPGEVKIVGYGTDALASEGNLLNLHFTARDEGKTSIVVSSLRLNEDRPLSNVTQGTVDVQPPTPTAASYHVRLPLIQQ